MSLVAAPVLANAQMSTRSVKAMSRPKASGLPFNAWFTDVAAKAGLTSPVIYGGVDANAYILEAIGCGAAFLDYDNDGWLDIFLLSGTRWEGAPPEHDQPPLPQQSRRHIFRRDRKGRPHTYGMGLRRDCGRLQQ